MKMKRALLLMVVPALLVALGFAQTPATSVNTDQTSIKGCLAGSDGNYTVVQDNTGHVFKIATSSVDLKPHVGHDVTLVGHKASGDSSAAADNGFAVTELNLISEHCAAAAAAPIATVATPAVPATVAVPAATAVAPAATTSALTQTEVTPPADATAPAATIAPPAETAIAPPAAVTPPAETAVAPAETVSALWDKPAADAADTRLPTHSRRPSPTPAPAAVTPTVTASASSNALGTSDATAAAPAATASAPDAVATTPVAPAKGGSLWLLIALGVVVIVIGTLVPFLSRWRKRRSLEQTGTPNLSFTREAISDQEKSDPKNPRKAA